MKQSKILMGMTITLEIIDAHVTEDVFKKVFSYFENIDERFSTYKDQSEISQINRGEIKEEKYSQDMKTILALSEQTKKETDGYFDIRGRDGKMDPSGLVKGWAINNAAEILRKGGFKNFYIDAGGDIQVVGNNAAGEFWRIGIRNPFNPEDEIIKVVELTTQGLATSGTYARGQHIYDPHHMEKALTDVVSLSVIGPDIYEADRFATAAFAMGLEGINFIESLDGFEGYMIDSKGIATMTSGFFKYTK